MAITFYIVCKNGSHEAQAQEVVERFEIDMDYSRGLKLWRLIIEIFKRWKNVEMIKEA